MTFEVIIHLMKSLSFLKLASVQIYVHKNRFIMEWAKKNLAKFPQFLRDVEKLMRSKEV